MKTVIEMAREADIEWDLIDEDEGRVWYITQAGLERFAEIVRADSQRKPLTDEQIESLWDHGMYVHCSGITALRAITRAIEAAHGIGEKK